MGNTSSTMYEVQGTYQGPEKEGFQIFCLGKTGSGKSHTGNTILGLPNVFKTKCSSMSVTKECESKTATVNGRPITYIDTPGFFDTVSSEKELSSEILRSYIKCSRGPQVFLIILKVETYTDQEIETVKKITETFGEDALKYAVVLFTHGDNLGNGQTIEQFVSNNKDLQQLVDKCGSRCHVIDNKYWNHQKEGNRSNRVQVEKLRNTIEDMVKRNDGQCYTNEMLQCVRREIQETEKKINRKSNGKLTKDQIRDEAENRVHTKLSVRLAGVATGVLLGALLGIPTFIAFVINKCGFHAVTGAAQMATTLVGINPAIVVGVAAGGAVVVSAVSAAIGGMTGHKAVEGEETVWGAIKQSADACVKKAGKIGKQGK